MGKTVKMGSIFSQKLDRAAFTAYFLGAIVPLIALAFVVDRYALRDLSDSATLGLLGLVVSISALSLGSFLILRRTTRGALQQMNRDNDRLESLLDVSTSLANSVHENEAATTATVNALALTGARAAFILLRGSNGEDPVLLESAGRDASKLLQTLSAPLAALAAQVMGENRPAICDAGSGGVEALPGVTAAAIVPLAGERAPLGVLAVICMGPGERFEAHHLDALKTLSGLTSVALRNADLRDSQRNFFAHVTEMLVSALDVHLGYHAGHGDRVARLANRIGRELNLCDEDMQRLHFASLLHDIGMLKIDRPLLDNTRACAKHTILGARMLARIRLWREIAPLVQSHHERVDGSGYPDGLTGDEIPLLSRIIAVCEAFDSMTSSTSYKVAVPFEEAVAEINAHSGTQFDTGVVQAFARLVEAGAIETEGG